MKKAIIIGAGPAGLTAAFELLQRSAIRPIVFERTDYIGGISRTANYKGNRIDIGGHRFFSKSDRVMNWWLQFMPLEQGTAAAVPITYQQQTRTLGSSGSADSSRTDTVMLVRPRKSRIYFLRRFFDYPIRLSADTLRKLGAIRTFRIGISYLNAVARPIKPESNLEEFFINRFGVELYRTFFRDYTEKVWGVPCSRISAEWGAQRVKGLSILKTVTHIVKSTFKRSSRDLSQKETETSLIERFLYPKFGPGQLWEEVARHVRAGEGEIHHNWEVVRMLHDGGYVNAIEVRNSVTGEIQRHEGDYFFSTMAIKDLMKAMDPPAPPQIRDISDNLIYRDFITVGLLCRRLRVSEHNGETIRDNWIYIQEPDVKIGRLQVFNNWSPYMVAEPGTVWLGLEYFCFEGDDLWTMSDEGLKQLGIAELVNIGIIDESDVLDGTVIRMQKTYPAYFGAYERFPEIIEHVSRFKNLFLVGRNGMHRYNNQDHSMLTAMVAVDNIVAGIESKQNIWAVNTEQEYHEEKEEVNTEASSAAVDSTSG
jgi:protoporphyrinogen oxidase